MEPNIHASWRGPLEPTFNTPRMQELKQFLLQQRAEGKVLYPPMREVFAALNATPLPEVKVVILGQDPYHGPGQAHGLSFSVRPDQRVPPSLVNIYKELHADLGVPVSRSGCLTRWAEQGVLLLNSALTVEQGRAGSHRNKGWEPFTDAVVRAVSEQALPSVFLLWGKHAQEKGAQVDRARHCVIETSHPSPMGDACNRGFFGSRPFSRANAFLTAHGRAPIDWQLDR